MSELSPEEKLRADVGEIMRDPLWGKDPRLEAKVDGMYKKAHPGKVVIGEGIDLNIAADLSPKAAPRASVPAGAPPAGIPDGLAVRGEGQDDIGPDAAARTEFIKAPLRQEWGPDFETRYAEAQGAAQALFTGHTWQHEPGEIFSDLGRKIRAEYGPAGETLTIKFLADLGRIKKGA